MGLGSPHDVSGGMSTVYPFWDIIPSSTELCVDHPRGMYPFWDTQCSVEWWSEDSQWNISYWDILGWGDMLYSVLGALHEAS